MFGLFRQFMHSVTVTVRQGWNLYELSGGSRRVVKASLITRAATACKRERGRSFAVGGFNSDTCDFCDGVTLSNAGYFLCKMTSPSARKFHAASVKGNSLASADAAIRTGRHWTLGCRF
jgi:hypothetical protein